MQDGINKIATNFAQSDPIVSNQTLAKIIKAGVRLKIMTHSCILIRFSWIQHIPKVLSCWDLGKDLLY